MNLGQVVGVGGPAAIVAAILGFLVNAFMAKRKDDREETKSSRESESGIVETTSKALKIVREQMESMDRDLKRLQLDNERLKRRVERLEDENRQLKAVRGV